MKLFLALALIFYSTLSFAKESCWTINRQILDDYSLSEKIEVIGEDTALSYEIITQDLLLAEFYLHLKALNATSLALKLVRKALLFLVKAMMWFLECSYLRKDYLSLKILEKLLDLL